jgi:hypothetical protein
MISENDLHSMHAGIVSMKQTALNLRAMADDMPCLKRNLVRILASLKMLEINISDLVELE